MADKQQFDINLGGNEKLPREAHVMSLVAARANEMAKMNFKLQNPQQTKMIFQKLPIHMRRRVMSHNAKRMPRKLRISHLSQMSKSGLPPKTKRPSRKFRRRPQNLLAEYNRRQKNKLWLETHIWHAKRFKMIQKWGFKLPYHSNDRCFKSSYRAITNHCLIQDISYYTCLEISGPLDILKEKLKKHCDKNELTFGAKIYVNGEREGTLMFYKLDGCPTNPIGYVHFLWKFNDSDVVKTIWLWIHPAFYGEVLQAIINNFDFKTNEKEKITNDSNFTVFSIKKIPTYFSNDGCKMFILRNCLNRFRLTGPLALTILTDAFKLPNVNSQKLIKTISNDEQLRTISQETTTCPMEIDDAEKSEQEIDLWYRNYYQSRDNVDAFNVQKNMFDTLSDLKSANQLPPNDVLALTILDPRFFFPPKRTKILSDSVFIKKTTPLPPTLANKSPLWNTDTRNYVSNNFTTVSAINKLRSKNLIPGVANDQYFDENIMHKVPIMLIQKPGNYLHNNSIGFASSIDIVLPATWSMPVWLSLILRCARSGGLREAKSISYENSCLDLPEINHPDTIAYQTEANLKRTELTERYFKLPPNKRCNYVKFGISSPFFCEWKLLMKEWNDTVNYYVLRNRQILSLLKNKMSTDVETRRKIARREVNSCKLSSDLNDVLDDVNCYVPVKVTIERKGIPKDFSIICLPTKEDLVKFNENKKWSGPIESCKSDSNEEKRKNLRNGHQALLRRLRRKRICAKKKMDHASSNFPLKNQNEVKHLNKIRKLVKKKLINQNAILIQQHARTMANLYLPKCEKVRLSCDREVIGYVTLGGFSFSKAKGVGLGYVVVTAIKNMINDKTNFVLVRNTSTRKYRLCKLEILC